jgi:3-hydroxyisobutyrate dehydrogenase-like beta-hydroxyacid dehydrogenase
MPRKSRKNVGLIGLGIIGSRVATGLRAAGFQVYVWNRSAKPAPNFLGSPAEIAQVADIIQIFVADAAALFEVIEAMADALTPEHVVVCNATVGPEAVIEAARFVQARGASFLDAPFTGSKVAAEKRQLVYYIGGGEAVFQRAKPVLEATSKTIVRIGEIGHAATVKVVTNMISAVTVQTLAEGLAIVQRAGLNPEVLAAAIEQNACRSGVVELKLPKMVAGDYEPHFSLKHMFKDVQLGIQMANSLDLEIPVTTVTAGVMYGAMNRGWADLDFSALYKIYAPHGPEKPAALPAPAPVPVRLAGSSAGPVKAAPSPPLLPVAPASAPAEAQSAAPVVEEKIAKVVELSPASAKANLPKPPRPADEKKPLVGELTTTDGFPAAEPETPEHPINVVRRWFVSRMGG